MINLHDHSIDKRKLAIGLVLVFVAVVFLVAPLYILRRANGENYRKMAALQVELNNLIAAKGAPIAVVRDVKPSVISVDELVKKAEVIYSDEVKNERKGLLWIDRENATYMITLGALNGLVPGSRLSVYEGDKKIDEVIVEMPFDVISYVKPGSGPEHYSNNYYLVVIE